MKLANLFLEAGYSEKDINAKVQEAWDSIFSPDSPDRFYYDVEPNMGYLTDTGNFDVRTEGQSYGMMMAVQMDRKDIFDRIWLWTYTYMKMGSGPHRGFFAWSCGTDGSRNSNGPAPDGEEYFALALYFAEARWGASASPFNYASQANEILRDCIHRVPGKDGPPMWDLDNYQIKFVPDLPFTDPSYHLPHFYDIFAKRADTADRDFWSKAAAASRAYLPRSCHAKTGFAPEYANYDGSPNDFNGHKDFFSDSYRVAANIGLEAAWCGKKPELSAIVDKIQTFLAPINPADYRLYTIDGQATDTPCLHPLGLLATCAMGSLAATNKALAKDWVQRLWNSKPRSGERRYYDNCLYFFAVLALAGRFKVWE